MTPCRSSSIEGRRRPTQALIFLSPHRLVFSPGLLLLVAQGVEERFQAARGKATALREHLLKRLSGRGHQLLRSWHVVMELHLARLAILKRDVDDDRGVGFNEQDLSQPDDVLA